MSGRSELCKILAPMVKGKVISMSNIAETVRKSLGTEDEPFEGDVPNDKVEEAVLAEVAADRSRGDRFNYIFNGFTHKKASEFLDFANGQFGNCAYWINCQCDAKVIEERYKKKNEMDEIPEEVTGELADQAKAAEAMCKEIEALT